jgi:hypothetical protein
MMVEKSPTANMAIPQDSRSSIFAGHLVPAMNPFSVIQLQYVQLIKEGHLFFISAFNEIFDLTAESNTQQ